jgi:hypothetical protein
MANVATQRLDTPDLLDLQQLVIADAEPRLFAAELSEAWAQRSEALPGGAESVAGAVQKSGSSSKSKAICCSLGWAVLASWSIAVMSSP